MERESLVFIIDDDSVVLRALERFFRASGYPVEAFTSPRLFLDRLPYDEIGRAHV